MAMKITLTTPDGETHVATKAYNAAPSVRVDSAPCACGSHSVHGDARGRVQESHDTYRAAAVCAKCGAPRGVLRARLGTLFGLEEDERVMAGPWRVY